MTLIPINEFSQHGLDQSSELESASPAEKSDLLLAQTACATKVDITVAALKSRAFDSQCGLLSSTSLLTLHSFFSDFLEFSSALPAAFDSKMQQ